MGEILEKELILINRRNLLERRSPNSKKNLRIK